MLTNRTWTLPATILLMLTLGVGRGSAQADPSTAATNPKANEVTKGATPKAAPVETAPSIRDRVERAVRNLADPDPLVVRLACQELGELGGPARPTLPLLEEKLAHPDPGVRQSAATAVRGMKQTLIGRIIDWLIVIVMHAAVFAVVGLSGVRVYWIVRAEGRENECLIRSMSVGTALLGYIVMRCLGVSMPDLVDLVIRSQTTFLVSLLVAVVPLSAGMFLARLIFRVMQSDSIRAVRLLILVSVFVIAAFVDLYAALAGDFTFRSLRYALPNACFALGMMLWVVLFYVHDRLRPEPTGMGADGIASEASRGLLPSVTHPTPPPIPVNGAVR